MKKTIQVKCMECDKPPLGVLSDRCALHAWQQRKTKPNSSKLSPVASSALEGERIIKTECGNPLMRRSGSYEAYTLIMESGRVFAICQSWGEINFYEVVAKA